MAGRLAVDFGTSNTRLALWDEGAGKAAPLRVPDVSELELCSREDGGQEEVPYIPSLLHFDGNSVWIGRQVREKGLSESNATFRWMKRYIANRLELPRQVNGRTIKFSQAGAEFLRLALGYAAAEVDFAEEEIAFTVPVECYEHYQEWLTTACEKANVRRYRLLDEASAAALGYGVGIQGGEAGYERDHIKAVLLVGGSSRIPSVRRAVRQMFGDRVRTHRPLDAVALGAAAFVGGVDFYDHIQHAYALRFYNRQKGDHDYKVLVAAGTAYPSSGSVAQLTVKASHDGQEFLGLSIFEVARRETCRQEQGAALDLVYDASGAARFQEREDVEIRSHFWVNEKCPTFIHAQPKATKGDPRFPVQFSIDGNKRLCVTVRDNETGKTLMKDHPVIKLT